MWMAQFFLVLGIHAIEIMFHMELNQLGRIIQLNKYICNMYSTYMAGGILSTH